MLGAIELMLSHVVSFISQKEVNKIERPFINVEPQRAMKGIRKRNAYLNLSPKESEVKHSTVGDMLHTCN